MKSEQHVRPIRDFEIVLVIVAGGIELVEFAEHGGEIDNNAYTAKI